MTQAPTLPELADRLDLHCIESGADRAPPLPMQPATDEFPTLVGHLSLTHPHQIQILGPAEIEWFDRQSPEDRAAMLTEVAAADPCGLIVSDGAEPPDDFCAFARRGGVPLLQTRESSQRLISRLRHFLSRELAARITHHGVFLDVLGTGVLLTGEPAIGKSELALELVSRGHSLVADDAPEFRRPAPDIVDGEAPNLLTDFLEVRGLGILNVRAMYGDAAIRHRKRLQLIIHLRDLDSADTSTIDRLRGSRYSSNVLGLAIPTTELPVGPGRNLAVLVEAAVRDFLLQRRGYDAAAELEKRQSEQLYPEA